VFLTKNASELAASSLPAMTGLVLDYREWPVVVVLRLHYSRRFQCVAMAYKGTGQQTQRAGGARRRRDLFRHKVWEAQQQQEGAKDCLCLWRQVLSSNFILLAPGSTIMRAMVWHRVAAISGEDQLHLLALLLLLFSPTQVSLCDSLNKS
jgi:hypothetical protein